MLLDVYLAAIPQDLQVLPVACTEREAYHLSLRESVRMQRFAAWRTLEAAIRRSFGLEPQTLSFHRLPSGKWVCDALHFSLSHTRGMVAAAVSDGEVGIDLENTKAFSARATNALAEKICTRHELETLCGTDELCALWTKKEALFKQSGGDVFQPNRIETAENSTVTQVIRDYTISVCGERLNALRILEERL